MQRSGFFHKLRAAAVLAARPAASCGAEGASRIRTFSSRGDDGRHGDSRGDGLDSSSPVTSAGTKEQPWADPFRGGGLRHDSGGGGGGESQQLLSQAAVTAAQVVEQHGRHWRHSWVTDDSAGLQEEPRVDPFRGGGLSHDSGGGGEGQQLLSQSAATAAAAQAAEQQHRPQLSAAGDTASLQSTADCLLRDANASTKETAASALVQRLQGLPGLRAVLRYFLTRACADLKGLLQRSTYAAAFCCFDCCDGGGWTLRRATVAAALQTLRPLLHATWQPSRGNLGSWQALQASCWDATAGTAVEERASQMQTAAHSGGGSGSGTGAGSTDDEHGDGQDSSGGWRGDDDGGDGTKACTPYAAAMMMLDAVRERKTDELLLLMSEGPVSMLVLSALQPAATLPLTAALNTSSGSSSDGINSSGGSFKPATRLEVDALAVRLKGATLLVVIQEAKLKSNLATARKQVARIGTLFAYAYNVAVAGARLWGGQAAAAAAGGADRVRTPERTAPAQRNQMVELVPAEGERHMMRVRVTGLAGCTFDP
ncbi:hypothetical protein HXX76_016291 [Chlamydomonas incerta]|uniref:Uncharacterized protein n=1 Tax=Chlamydomonas incerta TaxID=51695 RepID=A0A835VQT0_CHLIN|nr:hypothetical protein HXX76_016291 [Chlamydomonas incerta]|eukprot:KAG2422084.1 hypothetical protein HXX76_016291 [Chlamydomonas incerta]